MSKFGSLLRRLLRKSLPNRLLKFIRRALYQTWQGSITLRDGQEIQFLERATIAGGGHRYQQLQRDLNYLSQIGGIEYETTKEPETVEWLDRIPAGETLWDIGANVGSYSLYAAKQRDIEVLAFEPHYANFFALNENIRLSQIGDKVRAYCIAFSSEQILSPFYANHTVVGGSGSNLGTNVNDAGRRYEAQFVQGGLGMSLDAFTKTFGCIAPIAIKIDVDGLELAILRGANSLLREKSLRFVSVEMNDAREGDRDESVEIMRNSGFKLHGKFPTEKRRIGEYGFENSSSQVYNYQFERFSD